MYIVAYMCVYVCKYMYIRFIHIHTYTVDKCKRGSDFIQKTTLHQPRSLVLPVSIRLSMKAAASIPVWDPRVCPATTPPCKGNGRVVAPFYHQRPPQSWCGSLLITTFSYFWSHVDVPTMCWRQKAFRGERSGLWKTLKRTNEKNSLKQLNVKDGGRISTF